MALPIKKLSTGTVITIVAVALVLIGLIITFTTLKYAVNKPMFLIISIIASLAYGYVFLRIFSKRDEVDGNKLIAPIGLATLIWAGIVLGSASSLRGNHEQCIPTHELIYNDGNIPDPEAYLAFHKECPDNTIFFDAETEAYIRQNHRLPSWIVKQGYTQDAVNWVKAHDAPIDVANYIYENNGKIPNEILGK